MSIKKQTILLLSHLAGFVLLIVGVWIYYSQSPENIFGLSLIIPGALIVISTLIIALKYLIRYQPETFKYPEKKLNTLGIIYVILWLAEFISIYPDMSRIPSLVLLFIFIAIIVFFIYNRKIKGYSPWETITLKAKDEREQQIIDRAGRKAFAFGRILLFTTTLVFWSGLLPHNFKLNALLIGLVIMILGYLPQLFFQLSVKKLDSNNDKK